MNGSLIIKDCKLIEKNSCRTVSILIENGVIKKISDFENIENYSDVDIVKASGLYVTPGVIDCHVHLILDGSADILRYVKNSDSQQFVSAAENSLKKTITNGITAVRDMGDSSFAVIHTKKLLKTQGEVFPDVYTCGHMITSKNGHVKHIGWEINEKDDDIKKMINEQYKAGVDFIKLIVSGGLLAPGSDPTCTEMKQVFVKKIVQEAQKKGLKTAAHVYSDKDVETATEAGVWTIEHASWSSKNTLRRAAASKISLVPTIKASVDIIEHSDILPSATVNKALDVLNATRRMIPDAIKENINIAMGTDAGTPFNYHGDNMMELEYLRDFNISNEKLLEIGTTNSAKLLGCSNRAGRVKPGFQADLLLIASNPLDDISFLRKKLRYVIKNGRIVK